EADGERVCREVFRILRPGGWFCLDTPNARVCRIQQAAFIDPDHEIEYTHEQLSALLERTGFVLREAQGLNLAASAVERGLFVEREVALMTGMFAAIRDCYLLAYVCQKPDPASRPA